MGGFDVNERLVQLAAGVYVTEDVLGVVARIQEYDPNLVVKYLDPDRGGELDDPPYKIFERCPDGHERLVMSVWSLNASVIERIFASDTQKFDILAGLDKANAQARRDQRRYREEIFGAAREVTEAVVKSPKDTYTIPHPVDPTVTTVYSATEPVKRVTKAGTKVKASELME